MVAELVPAGGEGVPVESVEELADAVLALLDEVAQVDEVRAWARWAYSADGEVGGFRMPAKEVPAWLTEPDVATSRPSAGSTDGTSPGW